MDTAFFNHFASFNRTNPSAMRTVVDHGADPTGIADSSVAFLAANEHEKYIVVPPGNFRIAASCMLTKPLVPWWGSLISADGGVVVNIKGVVSADKYQIIFGGSGSFVGQMGSCVTSICWWGAVADGNYEFGTGTNALEPARKALNARTNTPGGAHIVLIPAGRFIATGTALPATASLASGYIQVPQGACLMGEGMGVTSYLSHGSNYGDFIVLGKKDSGGPPTIVKGFTTGGPSGGAFGCNGVVCWSNGATIRDMWVTGCAVGVTIDGTDTLFADSVIEYSNQTGNQGLRITNDSITCVNITIFEVYYGVVIDLTSRTAGAEALMPPVRLVSPVRMTDVTVTQPKNAGFIVTDLSRAAFTSCHVHHVNNGSSSDPRMLYGFRLIGVQYAQMNGCSCRVGQYSHYTDQIGLSIEGNSSNVSVSSFNCLGMTDAVSVNTTGDHINLSQINARNYHRRGLNIIRASRLVASNVDVSNPGTGAALNQGDADCTGVEVNVVADFTVIILTGVMVTQNAGWPLNVGVRVKNDFVNSRIVVEGVALWAKTTQLQLLGSSTDKVDVSRLKVT